MSEVSDITISTQLRSPRFICIHDGIVNSDRKQHDLVTLSFLFESLGYLILNPVALDPTFRTLIVQYLWGVAPGGRASSPERKRQSILRATEGFAIAPASANQQIV